MPPIDVVLIGVTGMLSHIVKGILDEPDIRVSAEYQNRSAVAGLEADVVIMATEDRALPQSVRMLLGHRPRTKVLSIRADGRETFLYELRPHETDLGQVSPQTLLAAVRTARTAPL